MAFRIVSVPLDKRTVIKPHSDELIVDTMHGNIGIASLNKDNDIEYNSATEKLKADLESLKIRNKNITKDLVNISYGSENNVENNNFNINIALENKDILGSLQYIHNLYQDYITLVNEENNEFILNENTFKYSHDLKIILNKLYINETNYGKLFKNELEKIYIEEITKEVDNFENGNELLDSEFNYIELQKLVADCIPLLYKVESEISIFENIINTINDDIGNIMDISNCDFNGNIEKSLKDTKNELIKLKDKTKDKKFKEFNFTEKSNIKEYRIDNDKFYFTNENEYEMVSENFNKYFKTSPFDDNYDGDLNLHQIDSYYNDNYFNNNAIMLRNTKSNYILNKQKYFYPPSVENILGTDYNYSNRHLVYDPVLKKPNYRYQSNLKEIDLLSYYINDNNLVLQGVYNKITHFTNKNILSNKSSEFSSLFFNFDKGKMNVSNYSTFYFPTLYNIEGFNESSNSTLFSNIFTKSATFNYDYFVGLELLMTGINKISASTTPDTEDKKDENTDNKTDENTDTKTDETTTKSSESTNTEGETTNPDDTTTPPETEEPPEKPEVDIITNTTGAPFYLLRDSLNIYFPNKTTNPLDDLTLNTRFLSNKYNEKFNVSNNKDIMANKYYRGFNVKKINNGTKLNIINTDVVKTDFNNYITALKDKLNSLMSDNTINTLKFPKFNNTDLALPNIPDVNLLQPVLNIDNDGNLILYNLKYEKVINETTDMKLVTYVLKKDSYYNLNSEIAIDNVKMKYNIVDGSIKDYTVKNALDNVEKEDINLNTKITMENFSNL